MNEEDWPEASFGSLASPAGSGKAPGETGITDAELEGLRQARFRERVQRVLLVMQRERVDFRGVPIITPEGRIAVRVVPVEGVAPPRRGEGEAGEV